MNIDLRKPRFRREQPRATERQPVIDPLPCDEEEVRLAESAMRGAVQRRVGVAHAQRMVVAHDAARHRDGVERHLPAFDEAAQRAARAGPPHAAAGNHHRPLGAPQQIGHAVEPAGDRSGRLGDGGRGRRRSGGRGEDVHRDGQVDGSAAPRVGFREGAAQEKGDLAGRGHLRRPLDHRQRHRRLIDVLEGLPSGQRAGAASADRDQRTARQVRGSDAGERIGVARSAGDQRQCRPAVDARPGVGRVRHAGFVPHIDDAQPRARGGGEDFVEVIAHQREDGVQAQLGSGLHEEGGAVWHRTAILLQSD